MAHPWRSEEERADYFEKQEVIADCSKCVSEEVCKYRHDYECPHFKNKAGYVEMKHGEWFEVDDGIDIGSGKHLECSICGKWKKDRIKSNYCPNCSAKMDGGKKE